MVQLTGGAVLPQWTAAHGGTVLRDLLAVTMNESASTQGFTFSSFCLFQIHMCDSLHQIDYGVIIHVLQAILRLFYGKNM